VKVTRYPLPIGEIEVGNCKGRAITRPARAIAAALLRK
jgi:hypothetical protein